MSRSLQIAPVLKSVMVEATPERAFEVFGAGIDRWWPKDHGIGNAPVRQSVIEPFVGGRWYAKCEDGSEVTNGHVLAWDPGRRMVFTWEISAHWKPDPRPAFTSEVEVRFIAAEGRRTRVELEHRNFERMGAEGGTKMRNEVDGGWPSLLDMLAKEIAQGRAP